MLKRGKRFVFALVSKAQGLSMRDHEVMLPKPGRLNINGPIHYNETNEIKKVINLELPILQIGKWNLISIESDFAIHKLHLLLKICGVLSSDVVDDSRQ